nr:S8 family serine peptidase [Pseudomonadales bacterium]NIX08273.1 S8 family serine peptidase [Pseudomonadales bacterium]
GKGVERAIKALSRHPAVRIAEPDYVLTHNADSNDPYYTNGNLWGMYGDASSPSNAYGSQAAEAWGNGGNGGDGYTGDAGVYIGVIDEGLQYTHEDLAANVWTNSAETSGDGIDNDGNGFTDDVHGWDFYNNDASVYDGTGDDHGTHVAGTIGGEGGNGVGVAGVSWDVTLISAKFLGPSGGSTSGAIAAVDYITDLKTRHGLNIVATSNSWGGGGFSQLLLDAINRGGDEGILFVAAAGNSSRDTDGANYYPSNYECTTASRSWDCVISVASITSSGTLSSFSNWGATTVDMGAPGSAIYSTLPDNGYGSYSGTSMATPHVSGAVALCESIDPTMTAFDLRNAVLGTAAATASLAGKTTTGGRLDIGTMVNVCMPPEGEVSGTPSGLNATATSTSTIALSWNGDGVLYEDRYEIQQAASCSGPFVTVGLAPPDSTSYTVAGLEPSTDYCFQVLASNRLNGGTTSGPTDPPASATTFDPPPPYSCAESGDTWIDISGAPDLNLSDDGQTTVNLGFEFSFYSEMFDSIQVGSNGLAGFGGGAVTAYSNTAIPNVNTPNGFAAPFWDDLNPAAGGAIRAASPSSGVFVVSWEQVPHYGTSPSGIDVQLQLEEATGDIVIIHRDLLFDNAGYDYGASATVGVEDGTGENGTQISYNASQLSAPNAYRCSMGDAPEPPPPPPDEPQPPGAFTLSATANSPNEVSLSWSASANADNYEVVRDGGTPVPVGSATSYTDNAVDAGTTYVYLVLAHNSDGETASNQETVTTPLPPPSEPYSLSANATGSEVTVSWSTDNPGGTSYQIEEEKAHKKHGFRGAWTLVQTTSGTSVTLTREDGTYMYRARASNSGGTSNYVESNSVDVSTSGGGGGGGGGKGNGRNR